MTYFANMPTFGRDISVRIFEIGGREQGQGRGMRDQM